MPLWLKVILVVFVTGQGAYVYLRPRLQSRARRRLQNSKATAIGALRPGESACIAGVVAARDATLTSPVGRKACIGFWTTIDQKPSHGAGEVWVPMARREACGAFTVTDEAGTAVVEGPFRLDLDPDDSAWPNLPPAAYSFLEQEQGASAAGVGGDHPLRFQEAVLVPGDRVKVFGRASARDRIRGSSDDPIVVVDDDELIA
jgi:hypothetical protein